MVDVGRLVQLPFCMDIKKKRQSDAPGAVASAGSAMMMKKKPKRNNDACDESEFVSVEVGMRELKKRLKTEKKPSSSAPSTTHAPVSVYSAVHTDVQPSATTTPSASKRRKNQTADPPASSATTATQTPVKRKNTTVAPKAVMRTSPATTATTNKKTVTPRKTRASAAAVARKPTLAEVKAQLMREQQERVANRIQTLQNSVKSNVDTTATSVPLVSAMDSTVIETPIHMNKSADHDNGCLQSVQVDQNSQLPQQVDNDQTGIKPFLISSTVQVPNHTVDPLPDPIPVENEFIANDFDEDMVFLRALEEVESKLAASTKSPIPELTSIQSTPPPKMSDVPELQPIVTSSPPRENIQVKSEVPQPSVQQETQSQTILAVPDILQEYERLKKENELLRQSNERLQAVVITGCQEPAAALPIPVITDTTSQEASPMSAEPSVSIFNQKQPIPSTEEDENHHESNARNAKDESMIIDMKSVDRDENSSVNEKDKSIAPDTQSLAGGDISDESGNDNNIVVATESLDDCETRVISENNENIVDDAGAFSHHYCGTVIEKDENAAADTNPSTVNNGSDAIMVDGEAENDEVIKLEEPFQSSAIDCDSHGKCKISQDNSLEDNTPGDSKDEANSTAMEAIIHTVPLAQAEADGDKVPSSTLQTTEPESNRLNAPVPVISPIVTAFFIRLDDKSAIPQVGQVQNEHKATVDVADRMNDFDRSESLDNRDGSSAQSKDSVSNVSAKDIDLESEPENEENRSQTHRTKPRLKVIESSSESESEMQSDSSDSEEDNRCNGLEAALKAAAVSSSRKKKMSNTKACMRASIPSRSPVSAVCESESFESTLNPKLSYSAEKDESKTAATSNADKKGVNRFQNSATTSRKHKSTALWPALDDFYEFVLEMSPRRVRVSDQHQQYIRKYFQGQLPKQYSTVNNYCNIQLEAIMEELAASLRNAEESAGAGGAKNLYLTSVSPCGGKFDNHQAFPTSQTSFNSNSIFIESGFSGSTSNPNDYIVTFNLGGDKAPGGFSEFINGDLIVLKSPKWENYHIHVFGIVLCNSTVAVDGGDNTNENNQICVLVRVQDKDLSTRKENFSVLTEMCLANYRSPNWRWRLEQLHNTITSAREFQAIKSVPFFPQDMAQTLLNGKITTRRTEHEGSLAALKHTRANLSPKLLTELERKYNSSQLDAILGCIGEENQVIIQGPPGTGKTKTILGLLNALLDGAAVNTSKKSGVKARIRVGASLETNKSSTTPKSVAANTIRILVTAPSNAAVDELIVRLLAEGIYDGNTGTSYRPRIVRVGRPENFQQQSSNHAESSNSSGNKKIRKKMRKYAKEVEEILLENMVTKHRKAFPTTKVARQAILKNAQIVFCTLSGAGSVAMCDFMQEFDALIIDEAAQAVEASTLIPFKFKPSRIILVGDHRQLPATVISKKLITVGYERSLFQRLVENGSQVFLLNTQYRMHPEISTFPSQYFYDGKLVQEAKLLDGTTKKYHNERLCQPFLFFDVISGQQSQVDGSKSLRNISEVQFIIQLLYKLLAKFPRIDWKKKIGIIAPYKQQIYELGSEIRKLEQSLDTRLEIEVNTVDGFQGREKEIIIYSCVRTSSGRGKRKRNRIGGDQVLDAFWADERRMNVAITRAKSSLWIIGNSNLLEQSPAWRQLIQHAKGRNKYISDSELNA